MKIDTREEKIKEVLTRGVENIVIQKDLEKKLFSGRQLRIKHGVDPTTTDLHLGYSVVYRKLRQFQKLGHKIVFLIGGFTGRFGDPEAKLETRKMRPKKEVAKMAKNYIKQISKILDVNKMEIRDNSEWYDKMSAEELLLLMSNFTTARMLERDMFVKRQKEGKEIRFHEPVYPVLQAYDSVMLRSDLTVIGTDQLFNELQARPLQKEFKQEPQDIISVPLLIGTDGKKKMSQSLNNYISLNESPFEQYGKIMSIPDHLISQYFELCTDVAMEEIREIERKMKGGANPRDFKMHLAREVVSFYHSVKEAQKAEEEFIKIFQQKKNPDEVEEKKLEEKKIKLIDLLVKTSLAKSRGEARRVILQKGVKIDDKIINDPNFEVILSASGIILQKGKRHFLKIKR